MNPLDRHAAAEEASAEPDRANSPATLYQAGLRHLHAERYLDAQICCEQALEIDPDHADSLHLMGLLSFPHGLYDDAVEWIARAIRRHPKPDYLSNLGTALKRQGRHEEALRVFDKAVQLAPDDAGLWARLGDALAEASRPADAILCYRRALELDPRHWETAQKCGLLLHRAGRLEEARLQFERLAEMPAGASASVQPHEVRAYLGSVLVDLRRFDQALVHYLKAIEIKPDHVAALNDAGLALTSLRRPGEALELFARALSIAPDLAELFNNKANALKALGRLDDALACYRRAIALKPDYAEAHNNLGACLAEQLRIREALPCYRRALALRPDYPEAHWNLAVNRLLAGDLRTGWIEAEWRRTAQSFGPSRPDIARKRWLGAEPVEGKTVLVHSDQGLGDAIQFCRYLPLLAARGARIVLEVQPALRELLAPMPGVAQIIAEGEPRPDFDLTCPITSLPLAFDTTLETIPSAVPYLSAGKRAGAWKRRLGATTPRIGIAWSGNPKHANDHNRSMSLRTLLPLFDGGAQFVSLQKEVRADDWAVLRWQEQVLDASPWLTSFAKSAALISQLDLVISVDTSVAHLAGALGRPVWILLPYVPDWRWLLDRDDTPWYPTARLFRQDESRDYTGVVARLRRELGRWMGARKYN
ncbi:MAG: tetratricopeptide repeat protein [Bradyrhizobium sp.]|uniref:tetratricopeptide repeat protein n=1 Tax=Bradyrhizobium sp. TaxID=376 RepID=UPI001D9108C2|nr:tetratricopeptide repeat protein [Bradyrhizobium sp.]MBV9560131.1 tetratricopeptide repeat protein [Bradyrhizobium sp.]